nr:MAG TPA_asm: hypothetical protein [Caudoviricetes sp.]
MSKFDTLFSFQPENGDFCTRITPITTSLAVCRRFVLCITLKAINL